MSKFKKDFERIATEKFKSGFTYYEHYTPNKDELNYTVVFKDKTATISIDGLTTLVNSGQSIQQILREKLDKEFS